LQQQKATTSVNERPDDTVCHYRPVIRRTATGRWSQRDRVGQTDPATVEALLLARRAGLDLDVLRQALTDSAASSAFIRDSLGALLAGDYLTGFGLDRCCEELTTVTALGREHDVPFGLSALVERIHQRALTRYGPADGELHAVALLEEQAGIQLRHGPREVRRYA
jgi:hypothetical protein